MNKTKNCILLLITIEVFAISCFAKDYGTHYHHGFSVGPGVVVSGKPYKGVDPETHVFPFVMYQARDFYFRGPRIGYKIYAKDRLSVDALASWRFDGYESDDSSYLDGMDDRRMTLELGTDIIYRDNFGFTSFSILNDVLGRHNGQVLSVSYGKNFRREVLTFTPSLGLEWQSKRFVDYYYGVRAEEARVSRPAYDPSNALNPFLSLRLSYQLKEQWSLYGNFRYDWLDGEISESSIVEQSYKASWMFGLIYSF
jgi:outer membrane protein